MPNEYIYMACSQVPYDLQKKTWEKRMREVDFALMFDVDDLVQGITEQEAIALEQDTEIEEVLIALF